MNKSIISQLMLLLFVTFSASAMEIQVKEDPLVPDSSGICYLTAMPVKVLDNIASYVGWETVEAFIKRTDKPYDRKFLQCCKAVSADRTKKALFCGKKAEPYIRVFNFHDNKNNQVLNLCLGWHYITSLDFNEQGTHLLLRSACYNNKKLYKKRMIIPLKAVVHYKMDSSNGLQEYFGHHMVCKRGVQRGDPSKPNSNVYCLAKMPLEILNYIASFLMETDEEFIARISAEKEDKQKKDSERPDNDINSQKLCVQAYNFDKTKLLNLTQKAAYADEAEDKCGLGLYDCTIKKAYVYKEKLEEDLDNLECHSLALSPSGRMFAFSHFKSFPPSHRVSTVEVIKMDVQEKKDEKNGILILQGRRDLFVGYFVNYMAFNKQGNKVIAYHTQKIPHQIFSLKTCTYDKPQVVADEPNKLQCYLRDKFVCNKLITNV